MADLYSNEDSPALLNAPESEEEGLSPEEHKILEEGRALTRMVSTRGWKIVEKFAKDQVEYCKERLIDEPDPEKIKNLQIAARCWSNMIGQVASKILEGKAVEESQKTNDPE